ncbi:MAG: M20/M25/M40 family metallo-hydrolase [Saprospiraceae bacterium]|nr:M20/M25/M40 family metallo-hydrolase [Saprospiraceae bacterium]
MRNIQTLKIFCISLLIFTVSCSKKTTQSLNGSFSYLSKDIVFLSSDEMEGREIGTEGERKAGEYIAGRFKEIGLKPAGDQNSYFMTFSRKKSGNPHGDEQSSGGVEVTGRNILGIIDNNATSTVVIGGHYDHLGYGQEGSLYVGSPAIHNGADDNSSGVAGVLYLAESIKKSGLKKYNYLFICFSGEEKGLWGSNYFVNNTSLDKKSFNYMVNMDMIGRLNKERKLAISGVGTSPVFESVLNDIKKPSFSLKKDSSGLGPSDHATFYNSGIPVLAFFTGQHGDYHKPSDDAHLINYEGVQDIVQYIYTVVSALDKKEKLTFTKTRDESQTRMSFNVTLGIMPDYLYDGTGVKIDGVKDGKPAQLAGMQKGDIVTKLGDMEVKDMQSYMKCLTVFKSGQTVTAIIIRDGKELDKQVTF